MPQGELSSSVIPRASPGCPHPPPSGQHCINLLDQTALRARAVSKITTGGREKGPDITEARRHENIDITEARPGGLLITEDSGMRGGVGARSLRMMSPKAVVCLTEI